MTKRILVGLLLLVYIFILCKILVFKEVPTGNRDLFNVMIGVVCGSTITAVMGWLYTTNKQNHRQEQTK